MPETKRSRFRIRRVLITLVVIYLAWLTFLFFVQEKLLFPTWMANPRYEPAPGGYGVPIELLSGETVVRHLVRVAQTGTYAMPPARYYRIGQNVLGNLVANWTVNDKFDLLVGGRNLFDRNYQLVDGFPEQGRNFYLSLRARY